MTRIPNNPELLTWARERAGLDTLALSGRFPKRNALIDAHVGLAVDTDEEGAPSLKFLLPGGDELPLNIEVSRLLYQLDREAYVEALNAARSANQEPMDGEDQPSLQGAETHGEKETS